MNREDVIENNLDDDEDDEDGAAPAKLPWLIRANGDLSFRDRKTVVLGLSRN